jgi:hypothetical protein
MKIDLKTVVQAQSDVTLQEAKSRIFLLFLFGAHHTCL